jgi:hypothetical protein
MLLNFGVRGAGRRWRAITDFHNTAGVFVL